MTFLVLPEINFSVVFAVGFIFSEDAQLARHMLSSGLSGFNTHSYFDSANHWFYFELLGAFLCRPYQQYFTQQIKCNSFAVRTNISVFQVVSCKSVSLFRTVLQKMLTKLAYKSEIGASDFCSFQCYFRFSKRLFVLLRYFGKINRLTCCPTIIFQQ